MKSDQTEHNNNNSDDDNDDVMNSFFTFEKKKGPQHFLHISKHAFMHTCLSAPSIHQEATVQPTPLMYSYETKRLYCVSISGEYYTSMLSERIITFSLLDI